MYKLLLSTLAIALLFSCGNNENKSKEPVDDVKSVVDKNSSLSKSHLKGMVQTIEETLYTPDETGKIAEMDSCCIEFKEFDKKGYTLKSHRKDSEGAIVRESEYKYLDGGRFESVKRTKDGNHLWSRTVHYGDDDKAKYAEDRDSTGQVSRIHTILSENELGQSLHGTTHTVDSTYLGTWTWKITDGMRTGFSWVDSTDTKLTDNTGELNDNGFMAKMTKIKTDDEGTNTVVETYTYDGYDEKGNWTQRTIKEDGVATKVEKRKYTYFK